MTSQIEGTLEIDHERGVIYFHRKDTGSTLLRICSLPPIERGFKYGDIIDITHMQGVSLPHVPPFVPGQSCTTCRMPLPADHKPYDNPQAPYTCPTCLPRFMDRKRASDAAKRAVATKRKKYPVWPANRKSKN